MTTLYEGAYMDGFGGDENKPKLIPKDHSYDDSLELQWTLLRMSNPLSTTQTGPPLSKIR